MTHSHTTIYDFDEIVSFPKVGGYGHFVRSSFHRKKSFILFEPNMYEYSTFILQRAVRAVGAQASIHLDRSGSVIKKSWTKAFSQKFGEKITDFRNERIIFLS